MKINNLTGKPDAGIWKDRGTGKSTALALAYIAEAMYRPGKRFIIHDHHNVHLSNQYLGEVVSRLIEKLGLEFIEYRKSDNSICFNLYSESDEYIEVNGQVYKRCHSELGDGNVDEKIDRLHK